MSLSREIAGLHLAYPLMNAAGTAKTLGDVKILAASGVAAIMVGSITLEPRIGNLGLTYWADAHHSLNSKGLPNAGIAYYQQRLPGMVAMAHDAGKTLWVSVAAFSPKEYAQLAKVALQAGADLVELNLGCPNVWQGSTQKRIPCFDSAYVSDILYWVQYEVKAAANITVKLSPFSNPCQLEQVAEVLGRSAVVKAVVTTNTFPNAFDCDIQGNPRTTHANGLAGLGGPALLTIGLGQVCQLRALLPPHLPVIGVGGITKGQDIHKYLVAGAAVTQVATAYLQPEGAAVFTRLLQEFNVVANT